MVEDIHNGDGAASGLALLFDSSGTGILTNTATGGRIGLLDFNTWILGSDSGAVQIGGCEGYDATTCRRRDRQPDRHGVRAATKPPSSRKTNWVCRYRNGERHAASATRPKADRGKEGAVQAAKEDQVRALIA